MSKELFMHASDVAKELGVSNTTAYKMIPEMNEELKKKGYMVMNGRISRYYFEEKFYGMKENNRQED